MRALAVQFPPQAPAPEQASQLLIGAIRRLAGARSIAAISEVVRSTARRLVGADGATLVLRHEGQCFYVDEEAISPLWKGQRFPLTACISGWAMLHQEQVAISNIYADDRIPHDAYRPTFVKSLVMTPVRREGTATAAIGTYWAHERGVSTAELAFLQDLADSTAVAMENAEVYAELERRVEDRTRELVAANRELEAFSYTVAHDLRTPLTSIIGFADLAESLYGKNLDDDGREIMRQIVTAGRNMSGLIGDLLEFARCTQVELKRVPVDLSALAREVAEELKEQHSGRALVLDIEPTPEVLADPRSMKVVLHNLLGNALKYTRNTAAPVITVGHVPTAPVPTFFVRDNGAGFDTSLAANLFKPFQRLHTGSQFEGTGVGLSTVARVVARHGGQVWAEAKVDAGATFYFSLPGA